MNRSDALKGELKERKVDLLDLDSHNPRLPEELIGKPQPIILRYLYDNLVLEELAQSFLDNGFFVHEPLIITPGTKGRYIVLEGNRRLAALMILHGRPEASDIAFDLEIPEGRLDELKAVPCFEVKKREEVFRFLGFRHIGGIKTWGAEAKARYLAAEVDKAVAQESTNPFRDVGRRVGSNAQGVRNSYVALALLRHAREEFSIDVKLLQNARFGVWLRILNSPDIRKYIGLGDTREYGEIKPALKGLNSVNLKRVVSDWTPPEDRKKAVVEDSRDITDYGRILQHPKAAAVLARYGDFAIARQIVDEADLPKRLEKIANQCQVILQEVQGTAGSKELVAAAEQLLNVVRAIFGAAKELAAEPKP